MRPLYRSMQHKKIAGVCAGFALAFDLPISGVRLLFLLLASTGTGLLLYLAAWLLMPVKHDEAAQIPTEINPLTRSRSDRKIAGVCAGIARFLNIDVTLVRIVLVMAVCLGGMGILPYLLAWIVIPEESDASATIAL